MHGCHFARLESICPGCSSSCCSGPLQAGLWNEETLTRESASFLFLLCTEDNSIIAHLACVPLKFSLWSWVFVLPWTTSKQYDRCSWSQVFLISLVPKVNLPHYQTTTPITYQNSHLRWGTSLVSHLQWHQGIDFITSSAPDSHSWLSALIQDNSMF